MIIEHTINLNKSCTWILKFQYRPVLPKFPPYPNLLPFKLFKKKSSRERISSNKENILNWMSLIFTGRQKKLQNNWTKLKLHWYKISTGSLQSKKNRGSEMSSKDWNKSNFISSEITTPYRGTWTCLKENKRKIDSHNRTKKCRSMWKKEKSTIKL